MKNEKLAAGLAAACVTVLLSVTAAAAAKAEEAGSHSELVPAISFVWMAGYTDFDGHDSEADANRYTVNARLHRYASIELSYLDLGEVGNDGIHLAVVPTYNLKEGLTLFAPLGWAAVDQRTGGLDGDWFTYGLGLSYDLPYHFGLRAQWDHFDGQGDTAWLGLSFNLRSYQKTQ